MPASTGTVTVAIGRPDRRPTPPVGGTELHIHVAILNIGGSYPISRGAKDVGGCDGAEDRRVEIDHQFAAYQGNRGCGKDLDLRHTIRRNRAIRYAKCERGSSLTREIGNPLRHEFESPVRQ